MTLTMPGIWAKVVYLFQLLTVSPVETGIGNLNPIAVDDQPSLVDNGHHGGPINSLKKRDLLRSSQTRSLVLRR
jgi:hypothetical protein